jgi:hypothetical protein
MQTYHDREADCTFVTQLQHPFVGSLLLVMAVVVAGLAIATPYLEKEREWWFWFLLSLTVGFAAFLLRMCLEAFTEIVLIFDGRSRTLTVDSARPWRKMSQNFRFADIIDVAGRSSTIIAPDASLYVWVARSWWFDITLSGNRRIRLRADSEAEQQEAWNQVRRQLHPA